jgi:hypothetical protein
MSEFDEDHLSDLSEDEAGYTDKAARFEREDAFLLANLNSLSVESAAPAAVEISLADVGYSRELTKINVPMPDKLLFVIPGKSKGGKAKMAPDNQALDEKQKKYEKERRRKKQAKAKEALQREQEVASKAPLKYGSVTTLVKRLPGAPAAKQAGWPADAGNQPSHNPNERLLQRACDRSSYHGAQQQGSMGRMWQYTSESSTASELMPVHTGELRAVAPEFNPVRRPLPPAFIPAKALPTTTDPPIAP